VSRRGNPAIGLPSTTRLRRQRTRDDVNESGACLSFTATGAFLRHCAEAQEGLSKSREVPRASSALPADIRLTLGSTHGRRERVSRAASIWSILRSFISDI
jgi:hypothetical protein